MITEGDENKEGIGNLIYEYYQEAIPIPVMNSPINSYIKKKSKQRDNY